MSNANGQEFKEGQVWSYRTRATERGSTLLINKVEPDGKGGFIFHISITGLSLKNDRAPGGVTHELPHLPVSSQTLNSSVVKLMGSAPPNAGYRDGYATWRQAFEAGRAGVFTISVAEIVAHIEKTIQK
jgi:hypothetical protein